MRSSPPPPVLQAMRFVSATALLLAGASMASCANRSSLVASGETGAGEVLIPADFVAASSTTSDEAFSSEDGAPTLEHSRESDPAESGLFGSDSSDAGALDANASALDPSSSNANTSPFDELTDEEILHKLDAIQAVGEPLTVSGLVGQINGRPIYVEQVFRPIADRIRINGLDATNLREFIQLSYPLILQELVTVIDRELLLAEAERNLTERERSGLLYWLSSQRERQVRAAGGSQAELEDKLLTESGITFEEQMDVLRRQVLASEHLRKEIGPRIAVSWRDIERYYENHPDEFNSSETIQLRLIKLAESSRDLIPQVREALEDGQPFENVARDYSSLLASTGGLLRPGSIDGATNIPEVNAIVPDLGEHEYAGPIESANGIYWVYVEDYQKARSVSLYDAQREIQEKLVAQAVRQEEIKYKYKLRERANFNTEDVEYMAQALLAVAVSRWRPQE